MKFTKEQLLESLKAKLSNNGKKNLAITDRTITPLFESLYKRTEKDNDEELELDDAVAEYATVFEAVNGNIQKDNSDFIKKWKEEHPETAPKVNNEPDKNSKEPVDKLDILLNEIESLKKERATERIEKAISEKRLAITNGCKEKGITDDKWISCMQKAVAVDAETDVNDTVQKFLDIYNLNHSKQNPSITPNPTGGDPAKKEDFSDVVAIMKRTRGEA